MALIAPFASYAPRDPKIMSIFLRTKENLQSVRKDLNTGIPPTLALKEKLPVHPSKNVILGGSQKTKRSYTCSNCHEPGHNCASYPYKNKN